jgi:hypothetical protein
MIDLKGVGFMKFFISFLVLLILTPIMNAALGDSINNSIDTPWINFPEFDSKVLKFEVGLCIYAGCRGEK